MEPEQLMARSYRQFQMERALPELEARVAKLEVGGGCWVAGQGAVWRRGARDCDKGRAEGAGEGSGAEPRGGKARRG